MKQGDFTEVAKHYHNRPAYSSMLLEKLLRCVNDSNKPVQTLRVVDVGAGTGKLTKMLANFGLKVYAVEPNDNMRQEGIKYTQNTSICWSKGSGENTGIESNFADWVIMASSFHWTNPSKSLPEFARILKDRGYFTAIWNPRNIQPNSIFHIIESEIKRIVPELNRVSSGTQNTKNWEEILVSTEDFEECFFMECDYVEMMDRERYIGAWHSVNDIQAQAGRERWQKIIDMIESHIKDLQIIEIPYKIRAWSVRKKS
ncbi:class I SAM-dependent methyltransferase [Helicobacter muridarum]|uniref:Class I SAM-dependent methyltransferase n=1 Tax=Helicobacter muridarum TaxID=216 RepID=A0A099TXD7_9HELI|nr:class I SAM-dependent methyltransferase [Helicobacter muridarum]TLE00807.1 class I SAM-dependent methyltransferase [Helicobacter muridarum]STQ86505.1 ubiquinone/menaquinone biosynthesis methyltransferase [Helicobacter muridarum]